MAEFPEKALILAEVTESKMKIISAVHFISNEQSFLTAWFFGYQSCLIAA